MTTHELIKKATDLMVAHLKNRPYGEYNDFCCALGPPRAYFMENLCDVEYVSKMVDYHVEESVSDCEAGEIATVLTALKERLMNERNNRHADDV